MHKYSVIGSFLLYTLWLKIIWYKLLSWTKDDENYSFWELFFNIDHVLLHSEVALSLWQKVFRKAGMSWLISSGSLALLSIKGFCFWQKEGGQSSLGIQCVGFYSDSLDGKKYDFWRVEDLWERVRLWSYLFKALTDTSSETPVRLHMAFNTSLKEYSLSYILLDWKATVNQSFCLG